jgi:hypothetical protein
MKYLVHCFTYDAGSSYHGFESDLNECELNTQLDDLFKKTEHKSDFVFQNIKLRKHGILYKYSVLSLDKFWEMCLKKSI